MGNESHSWPAGDADRDTRVNSICSAAEFRDDLATVRDFVADDLDAAANFEAFVEGADDSEAFETRELAHQARLRAKADRVSAELDRYLLSDLGPSADASDDDTSAKQDETESAEVSTGDREEPRQTSRSDPQS